MENEWGKMLMRYGSGHFQEEHLIFIHGGAYKVYGK